MQPGRFHQEIFDTHKGENTLLRAFYAIDSEIARTSSGAICNESFLLLSTRPSCIFAADLWYTHVSFPLESKRHPWPTVRLEPLRRGPSSTHRIGTCRVSYPPPDGCRCIPGAIRRPRRFHRPLILPNSGTSRMAMGSAFVSQETRGGGGGGGGRNGSARGADAMYPRGSPSRADVREGSRAILATNVDTEMPER